MNVSIFAKENKYLTTLYDVKRVEMNKYFVIIDNKTYKECLISVNDSIEIWNNKNELLNKLLLNKKYFFVQEREFYFVVKEKK